MEEFEKEQLLLKKKTGLAFCQLSFLIMPFALGNLYGVFSDSVCQSIFIINPAEPALQVVLEWFGERAPLLRRPPARLWIQQGTPDSFCYKTDRLLSGKVLIWFLPSPMVYAVDSVSPISAHKASACSLSRGATLSS